jgi:ACS family hexuronate transporter-like MFS transporter
MPVPKGRWVLFLLSCSTLVNYLDRQTLSIVVPTLRSEMSLSSSDYGNITTAFLIAYGAGQVLAGGIIDRIGVRWGLACFVAFWSAAAMAHGFAQTAAQLLALRILLGLGEAGNWPAGVKAISEWIPKTDRAFSMGIFDGGSAIGAILAPPLVAALTLAFGWRVAFLATGSLGFLWLVFWLSLYRPNSNLSAAAKPGAPWALLANRQLLGLMATRLLATPVWWFYAFWLPDYLGKGRGLSLEEIGLFGWVPFVTVDLGKLAGGRWSDLLISGGRESFRARKTAMAAGALCMAGGLFVVDASSATSALAWVSLATFGFGMWSANILALHADLFDSANMATAVGWTTAASGLGGAAFTWLTGRLVDSHGYSIVFAMAGLAALVALGVVWFSVGNSNRKEARI